MPDALEQAADAVQTAIDTSYRETLGRLEARIVALESRPETEFDLTPVNTRLDELNDVFGKRHQDLDDRITAFETRNEERIEGDENEATVADTHQVETPVVSGGIQNTARVEKIPQRKHVLFHRLFG